MEIKTSDVIIPFNPQYLPKHAFLILQEAGSQGAGSWCLRSRNFSLLIRIHCLLQMTQGDLSTSLHEIENNWLKVGSNRAGRSLMLVQYQTKQYRSSKRVYCD